MLRKVIPIVGVRWPGARYKARRGYFGGHDRSGGDHGIAPNSDPGKIVGQHRSTRSRIDGANRVYLAHHNVGGYSKAVPCGKAPHRTNDQRTPSGTCSSTPPIVARGSLTEQGHTRPSRL